MDAAEGPRARDGDGRVGADGKPVRNAPRLQLIAPSASSEEAAAIVAALERFMRATAPVAGAAHGEADDQWWRAGVLEGVQGPGQAQLREPWLDS